MGPFLNKKYTGFHRSCTSRKTPTHVISAVPIQTIILAMLDNSPKRKSSYQ